MALLPEDIPVGNLVLRRWTKRAAPFYRAAVSASIPELGEWLKWAQHEPSLEEFENFAERFSEAFASDEAWHFVIWERDEVVGGIWLAREDTPACVGIGYWVRTDRTGRGYATMAARALTTVAFERLAWVRGVEIHMDSANRASAAIPPKIGYRLDREVDREVVTPGHSGHALVWSIDRESWNARSRPDSA